MRFNARYYADELDAAMSDLLPCMNELAPVHSYMNSMKGISRMHSPSIPDSYSEESVLGLTPNIGRDIRTLINLAHDENKSTVINDKWWQLVEIE